MQCQFSDNCLRGHETGDKYFASGLMNSYSSAMSNGYSQTECAGPFRIPKRRGRPVANNAARERSRVKTLRTAFLDLQQRLPAVPPDTKLSKLDVLVLATTYIAHLMSTLQEDGDVSQIFTANGCMHPVKKWPMRTRLYAGILSSTIPNQQDQQDAYISQKGTPQTWIHSSGRLP